MKKRIVIVVSVLSVIVLVLGGILWNNAKITKKMAAIHELPHVSTFTEQKGAEYAADQLDYLIVYRYTKDDLLKKWGTPNKRVADPGADVWVLSDKNQLVVYYDADREVSRIEVEPIQN